MLLCSLLYNFMHIWTHVRKLYIIHLSIYQTAEFDYSLIDEVTVAVGCQIKQLLRRWIHGQWDPGQLFAFIWSSIAFWISSMILCWWFKHKPLLPHTLHTHWKIEGMWECEGLSNLEYFDVVARWAQSNGREWSISLIYDSYVSIGWVPDINVEAFVQAQCQDDSKDEIETYSSLDFNVSHICETLPNQH